MSNKEVAVCRTPLFTGLTLNSNIYEIKLVIYLPLMLISITELLKKLLCCISHHLRIVNWFEKINLSKYSGS